MKEKYIPLFKNFLTALENQSECIKRKVGCLIVKDDRVIAEGWNSPPRNCETKFCTRCIDENYQSGKNLDQAICIHAEMNAISSAAYLGYSLKDAEIILSCIPCSECTKMIIACGFKTVYHIEDYDTPYTRYFLEKAGIKLVKI